MINDLGKPLAMIIKTKCSCGHVNQSETSMEWAKNGSIPVSCEDCGDVYMATATVDEETHREKKEDRCQEEETEFEIASRVIVDNKENELHQQEGIVVDKDFLHYKIKFSDGKAIWLPHHWVVLKKTT